MFSHLSKSTLAQAALFKNKPVYVQFYITARCNLTCQQCNIIYSNSDVRECNIDEIIGNVLLESTSEYGSYMLAFAPIDIIGTSRRSSLCGQGLDLASNTSALSDAQRFDLKEVGLQSEHADSAQASTQVIVE